VPAAVTPMPRPPNGENETPKPQPADQWLTVSCRGRPRTPERWFAVQRAPALPVAEIEAAAAYARAEKPSATREAYRSDFNLFRTWCQDRQVQALPASPEKIMAIAPIGRNRLIDIRDRALLLIGFAALVFLVGFAAADSDAQAFFGFLDVTDVE
jgi:hypothetical protein